MHVQDQHELLEYSYEWKTKKNLALVLTLHPNIIVARALTSLIEVIGDYHIANLQEQHQSLYAWIYKLQVQDPVRATTIAIDTLLHDTWERR